MAYADQRRLEGTRTPDTNKQGNLTSTHNDALYTHKNALHTELCLIDTPQPRFIQTYNIAFFTHNFLTHDAAFDTHTQLRL